MITLNEFLKVAKKSTTMIVTVPLTPKLKAKVVVWGGLHEEETEGIDDLMEMFGDMQVLTVEPAQGGACLEIELQ